VLARNATRYRDTVISGEQYARQRESDTYPVDHQLSDSDFRILCKILCKEYEDCGRKRGAILRYIKHYREQETEKQSKRIPTKRLLQILKSKSI